ncbi:MAG: PaaX family transcriptional regulator C-terminal domain-containing protein [Acidimicrobiales bacterium]
MLSTLLGTHPPRMPVQALIRVGQVFDISEGTVRVALSRMAADGDITAANGTYSLGERLRSRAERQDESRAPELRGWTGRWEMAVVTASGRSASERAALRRAMVDLRLAEQREGVWLRPANLRRTHPRPPSLAGQCAWYDAQPDGDPVQVAHSLWDLEAWADRARRLHAALDDASGTGGPGSLAHGFVVSAAVLRHLLSDPLLPEPLLPSDWPGDLLREQYERFDAAYRAGLRDYTRESTGRAPR